MRRSGRTRRRILPVPPAPGARAGGRSDRRTAAATLATSAPRPGPRRPGTPSGRMASLEERWSWPRLGPDEHRGGERVAVGPADGEARVEARRLPRDQVHAVVRGGAVAVAQGAEVPLRHPAAGDHRVEGCLPGLRLRFRPDYDLVAFAAVVRLQHPVLALGDEARPRQRLEPQGLWKVAADGAAARLGEQVRALP